MKYCLYQRDGQHDEPQGRRGRGGLRMGSREAKRYMRISTIVVVKRTGVVDGMVGHRGGMYEGGWN